MFQYQQSLHLCLWIAPMERLWTVSKFQPFIVKKCKFWGVITQLNQNAFNLTPQTIKSVKSLAKYGAQKKTPLLICR
jgi:hypothetical protein